MIEGNLNIDLEVSVSADNVGKLLHLGRMNRRNMTGTNIAYCRILVDWGDGTVETVDVTPLYTNTGLQPTSFTHTYTAEGTYLVSLSQISDKSLVRPYWFTFTKPSGTYVELPIVKVNRFNFNGISIKSLFGGSVNPLSVTHILNINIPDVNDLNSAFSGSSKFQELDIKGLSKITVPILDLKSAFRIHKNYVFDLNQLSDNWDISQVTDVTLAFSGNQSMTGTGQTFIDRLPSGVAGNEYVSAYLFENCKSLSDYDSIDNIYKDNI